jgi:hypothetical protein
MPPGPLAVRAGRHGVGCSLPAPPAATTVCARVRRLGQATWRPVCRPGPPDRLSFKPPAPLIAACHCCSRRHSLPAACRGRLPGGGGWQRHRSRRPRCPAAGQYMGCVHRAGRHSQPSLLRHRPAGVSPRPPLRLPPPHHPFHPFPRSPAPLLPCPPRCCPMTSGSRW